MAIPDEKLIGKNARLVGETYIDDFMAALNAFASVDEVFGTHRKAIFAVGRLVFGTLGKTEHENHLAGLVMAAAQTGEWTAIVRVPELHAEGLCSVVEKGFGHVVDREGKTYLLPSVLYIVHCDAVIKSISAL